MRRGGYVLKDFGTPDIVLMASGSEVSLAMAAADKLAAQGRGVRVVSMPSLALFAAQDAAWQEQVLPARLTRRVAIEAGVPDLWYRFVGPAGRVQGMRSFGESAPAKDLFPHFGFTVDHIVRLALEASG